MAIGPGANDWLRRAMRTFDAAAAMAVGFVLLAWLPAPGSGIEYPLLIVAGSLLLPACGEPLGLYQPWRGRSLYTMLGTYALSWLCAVLLLALLLVATQSAHALSRVWITVAALAVLGVGASLRLCLYLYLRHLRTTGRNRKRVLLVGTHDNVQRLEQHIAELPYMGYGVARVLTDSGSDASLAAIRHQLAECAFQRDFDEIWISYPLAQGAKVRQLASALVAVPVSVRYFPDLSDVRLLNHRVTQVAGIYSLELNYSPLDGPGRFIKAVEDRLIGLLLFALFLPVMLIVAALVRWRMGGPVLFKQYRHGLDGKRFRIYKFRTMLPHRADVTHQADHNDPRITPLGAFLRRTSLDELPQLYNVLQGRMSLVGPRPHALDHNAYYKDEIDAYMQRHRVKPGMTGWAQVNGLRGRTQRLDDMQKRVEYDLYYIDNWTLWLDLKILAMTVTRGFANAEP